MNELIKINETEINNEAVQTVNARELHAFLEISTAFKDWISRRVKDYDFKENLDFCSFLSESSGGRPSKEYHITLDMAKELAMVERNEKGREARRYFIECEKQLTNLAKQPLTEEQAIGMVILPEDKAQRIEAMIVYHDTFVKPLKKEVVELRPKGKYFDKLVDTDLLTNFRDTAKELELGQKQFIKYLEDNKYIYRDAKKKIKPYQEYVDKGFFKLKDFANGDYSSVQTLITVEGKDFFFKETEHLRGKNKNA